MKDKILTLNLTAEEINYILNVISNRPYAECYRLINNISEQAMKQNTETEN